jgi:hypothetical protein
VARPFWRNSSGSFAIFTAMRRASIKAQSGGVSTRRFEAGLLATDFVFG